MNTHEQIAELSQRATQLYQQGEYKQGIEVATQAYDLACQHLTESHPFSIASMSNLANLHAAMGNYAEAEPLLRQSLDRARVVFAAQDPRLTIHLNSLAQLYTSMGRSSKAESLYREALEINCSSRGETHPDFAGSLNRLAALYQMTGRYADAEPLYQRALSIYRQTAGERSSAYIYTLNNLGALYKDTSRYEAAENCLQEALEIRRQVFREGHPNVATGLNNLAELYREMGRYGDAEPLYQEAIALTRMTLGENHPLYAKRLNNLATLYRARGRYDDSELFYQQAIKIQRQIHGTNHPDTADSLNNLAGLYRTIGNSTKALELYQEVLEIRQAVQGDSHPNVATALNDLAVLYREIGEYAEAERFFRQAQEVWHRSLGEQHPNIAKSLHNLAVLYRKMGRYTEVQPLLEQALEIRLQTLSKQHPEIANNLNALGLVAQLTGNNTAAKSYYLQALKIQRRSQGKQHPDVAVTLRNLASLYAATDKPKRAIARLGEAEAINDQTLDQVFAISSESQRMSYVELIQQNFFLYLSLITQYFPRSPEAVLKALKLVFQRKGIGAEALVVQRDAILAGQYPALAQKLQDLVSCRMRLARRTLAGPRLEELQAHRQMLKTLNEQKEQLETELARDIPEMRSARTLQAANLQQIVEALPKDAALIEFVYFRRYNFKAIPVQGEAQWEPAHYAAFILLAGKPDSVEMLDLGLVEEIDRLIFRFRESITGEAERRGNDTLLEPIEALVQPPIPVESIPVELSDANAAQVRTRKFVPVLDTPVQTSDGQDLRQVVFDPLLEKIGDRKRLFIAPDGDLSRLPFEILPTNDGQRLIDEYRISYLSTGRDVLRFKTESQRSWGKDVVAADPDYRLSSSRVGAEQQANPELQHGQRSRDLNSRTRHFDPLIGTSEEGQQIAKKLGIKPWLKAAVLEFRLKACVSPRILHLATHGFFLPDQPQRLKEAERMQAERLSGEGLENPLLRSGLALAGAQTWLEGGELPEEAEDGILTAEDVSGLNLLNTELVVLSACETGLGEVKQGEGVFGLRRAFMLAGAKSLVMSLWKVPDQQTQELMVRFYDFLLQGLPRADALRKAQLEMKQNYANPFYWGAFICQGDIKPLPQ